MEDNEEEEEEEEEEEDEEEEEEEEGNLPYLLEFLPAEEPFFPVITDHFFRHESAFLMVNTSATSFQSF